MLPRPMPKPLKIVCPWLTPKVFPRFEDPAPRVREFFEHYRELFEMAERIVLCFAAGNGDHVLNYRGEGSRGDAFDWARYTAYNGGEANAFAHNLDWLNRVR